ncbi:hypothetical protein C4D60_Mb05t07550 [Musa balbisiana]|uniref:Cytochrome P450 n=1 Tax=Musa balbisiana TaxID=52838 RepID=A0A4S8JUG6_MUSBA|nr:hypothetical protein C4D60_Mb05t07550 [Musa balbisiana]
MDFFSSFVSLAAAVVGLVLLATRTWRALNSNRKRYPPVVGTIFHQFLNFRRLHDYHTQLSLKHKTFRLLSPLCHQIYTTDPAVVEYILKTNFDNYGKGWYNYGNMKDLFGDGIFAVDGDKWRHQRKLASFGFSTKVLREFSGAIFKRNAIKLAHVLSSYATSNEKFDMQVMRFLNIGGEKTLKSKVKLVDDFIYKLIRIRVEEMSNEGSDSEGKDDILSRFLEESRKDPQNIDLKYLRDIILNFVIAGKDTTAGTLSWFFYSICKNPPVQEKIYQEIKEVIEASEDAAFDAFAESIDDEALNNMHYLHAALSETLRLYPAVPLENKVCFADDALPGGYNVRKGDIVFYQPYAMGRMEYLWGKDAEIFRPERWLDDGGVFQPESPYKFSAFQAGPRICLGKEFAYRQMKIFAMVLLRFFKFKLDNEKKDVEYRTTTTLHIDQGLYLQIYTTDPAVVEYILKTNFDNYGKGWYNYGNMKDLFGDGIFAVDGDKWRHQRKLASFGFSTKVLREFSGAIFKRNAIKLAHVLSSYATSNEKFDMQVMRFLNIGGEKTLKSKVKLVDDFIYKLIRIRVEEMSNEGSDSEGKDDILSRFLEESRKDPQNIDLKYLRDIILNFVIAGKDTTAGTLSWFFYSICKNPPVQEKIYQEIKEVIEASEDAAFDAFAESIDDEALNNMHYLHAALSETLRLYPAVPLENKVCFADDALPGGYNVRKGDIVFYQPYAMGRMEYLWGKDAEIFRPERWLDDGGVFQPESPYKFSAFQAGPRICLGKEFAYRQMKIFAMVLLRFFKFKLGDEKKDVEYRTTTTLHIDQGLYLQVLHR